ncbi:MAG: acyl-CoA dehydrogenase family protein [Burkholderiales bacterium]|nr:acyl-CoA dehydrogenase family protein [Burkholderiales bacterium]
MPGPDHLGWPFFTDRHRAQAREFASFAASALPPLLGAGEENLDATYACVSRIVRALGSAGLLRVCVPATYGGAGDCVDARSLCIARETLARASGLADFAFAMQGLGSVPVTLFGSEAQKRALLPGIADGTRIGAFALSEPDAGSDVGAIATTATRDGHGNGWRLDGVKTWISNAGLADSYIVFARTGEAPGNRGLSAFIVDADAPGLDASERIDVIAPHPLGTLRFTGCRVAGDRLLGAPGEGFKIAMATLDLFRSTVGAAALGIARRAFDEAVARARERHVFGKALATFQLTQAKLADMATAIDASALLVYRAAWTRDVVATRVTRESSMAKLYATESAQRVVDSAVQLWGGLGVVRGTTVERLYREVRALRIYEGTSEVLQLVIGADALRRASGTEPA